MCVRFSSLSLPSADSIIATLYTHDIFGAGTRIVRRSMTETLPKLISSRAGYRAHLTKTLNKERDLMKKEKPNEMDVVSLNSIIEQLTRKKSILKGLDEKIVALIEEPNDLEQEIFETEEIQDEIGDTSNQISRFIQVTVSDKHSTQSSSPTSHQEPPQMVANETPLVPSQLTADPTSSGIQGGASVTNTTLPNPQAPLNTQSPPLAPQVNANHTSRLHKLNLPTFSGNPLHWFTFWDSFDASVHSNTNRGNAEVQLFESPTTGGCGKNHSWLST